MTLEIAGKAQMSRTTRKMWIMRAQAQMLIGVQMAMAIVVEGVTKSGARASGIRIADAYVVGMRQLQVNRG
jgi:hypothetical protein